MGTPLASAFAGGMMSGSIPQCSYAPSGAVRGTPAWISSKIRDRKSGGWGKRVDFGGWRVIKKKKKLIGVYALTVDLSALASFYCPARCASSYSWLVHYCWPQQPSSSFIRFSRNHFVPATHSSS